MIRGQGRRAAGAPDADHHARHQRHHTYDLRTHTPKSAARRDAFADHYARNFVGFARVGARMPGIWTAPGDDPRVHALVSCPDDQEPGTVARAHVASDDFTAAMAGFDAAEIVDVQAISMDAAAASPLR